MFGNKTYVYGQNGKLASVNDVPITYNARGQLASFDGNTYSYDALGNRIAKNNDTYSYTRGNLLCGINNDVAYSYNADGVRFQKIANGITTKFHLDGDKILGEDRSDGKKLRYFYDIDGLCGFKCGLDYYAYLRNPYGDIVGIMDENNILRASYQYDAKGNCIVRDIMGNVTTDGNDIGVINPFRWKSHYYDVESGLYYANGSYYDPEVALHVDAMSVSTIFADPFSANTLDLTGVSCDNILAYLPNVFDYATTIELSPDVVATDAGGNLSLSGTVKNLVATQG